MVQNQRAMDMLSKLNIKRPPKANEAAAEFGEAVTQALDIAMIALTTPQSGGTVG